MRVKAVIFMNGVLTTPFGWERLFEDNPWDNSSDNSNAVSYTEVDEESMFIVDEEILTVMDSIVEEHECTDNTCKTLIENSYSGIEPHERPSSSTERAYGSPKSQKDIKRSMECGVPEKTRNQTKWAVKVWKEWATSRNKKLLSDEAPFSCEIEKLSAQLINFWLCRFVLEIRRRDGERYPPTSLYQLCCGLLRHLRAAGRAEVNIFEQAEFHMFRTTLDSEMKRLSSTGQYIHNRQAEPITVEDESLLWELGLLGTTSPTVLLHTLVYMVGLYFALRSGSEHRRLRHTPAQIQLIEKPHSRPYLIYQEDISKTNQGGLHSRTKQPKKVIHYANTTNPDRCFIHIYKTYMSKCPSDRPAGAFYLQPLQKPKGDIWFSKVPCGHNTLQKIVPELMKAAGVTGYFTNHSLRASAATRLFEGGVDEQLIMSRTGHSSREGVRAYKRTTTKLSEVTSNVLNGEYHNGSKREASVSSSDLGTLSKKIVKLWIAVKRTFLLQCYK